MPSRSTPDSEVDWKAVEAAYTAGDGTIAELCEAFGISPSRLYRRAKAKGWAKRQARAWAGQPGRDRISRLYAALDKQMSDVERRLTAAQGDPQGSKAGDRERDARTLATLARTLEKLNAMAPDTTDEEGDDRPPDDIEEFRRELSRRLAELRRQGGD